MIQVNDGVIDHSIQVLLRSLKHFIELTETTGIWSPDFKLLNQSKLRVKGKHSNSTQVAAANFIAPVKFVALPSITVFSLGWCSLTNDPVEARSEQSIY